MITVRKYNVIHYNYHDFISLFSATVQSKKKLKKYLAQKRATFQRVTDYFYDMHVHVNKSSSDFNSQYQKQRPKIRLNGFANKFNYKMTQKTTTTDEFGDKNESLEIFR